MMTIDTTQNSDSEASVAGDEAAPATAPQTSSNVGTAAAPAPAPHSIQAQPGAGLAIPSAVHYQYPSQQSMYYDPYQQQQPYYDPYYMQQQQVFFSKSECIFGFKFLFWNY